MRRRLLRSEWLLPAIALAVALAGCKNGGGSGGGY
jgi:hypothetical protein